MSKLGETERRALKPDAQPFDEIRLVTKPRFKTSGMSGDEWRISVVTEFYRNGNLIHTNDGHRNMEGAVRLLDHSYIEASDNGHGYFASEDDYCDQEGCANKSTITYECVKECCGSCGEVKKPRFSIPIRQFCDEHKNRGNSNLDDMMEHYKQI